MASTDVTTFPVRGQAFRCAFTIKSLATGNPLTGGLTSLAGTVSKDGGSFASLTTAPTEIGTTGIGVIDLSATEMTARHIIVNVSASNTNAVNHVIEIRPVDLSDIAGHPLDATVKRFEQVQTGILGFLTNKHTLSQSVETVYGRDNTTVLWTGSVSGLVDAGGTVTRNKMS